MHSEEGAQSDRIRDEDAWEKGKPRSPVDGVDKEKGERTIGQNRILCKP